MRDLLETVKDMPAGLTQREQREYICERLLRELGTLSAEELAPYLTKFGVESFPPSEVVELRFPIRAHIFDSDT